MLLPAKMPPGKAQANTLKRLQLHILSAISDSLVPYLVEPELRFEGSRKAGRWPKNSLLPLIRVFPSVRAVLYGEFCKSCYLHFSY